MATTNLTPTEVRVLGCLVEKQRTTPDVYPLSLNALRNACNQSTNRDPVVDYSEQQVQGAAKALVARRWARSASGHGGRALKYRHLLGDALGLDPAALAILAVLMLRGPQTPGELKQRSARLHQIEGLEAITAELDGLIEAGLVERLPRRPGQKEERYTQLLDSEAEDGEWAEWGGEGVREAGVGPSGVAVAGESGTVEESGDVDAGEVPSASGAAAAERSASSTGGPDLEERVAALERQVEELRHWIED